MLQLYSIAVTFVVLFTIAFDTRLLCHLIGLNSVSQSVNWVSQSYDSIIFIWTRRHSYGSSSYDDTIIIKNTTITSLNITNFCNYQSLLLYFKILILVTN